MKIIPIAWASSDFMKAVPILRAVERHNRSSGSPGSEQLLVHTGQHCNRAISKDFFDDLGMPESKIDFGAASGSHAEQAMQMMVAFEKTRWKIAAIL